MISVDLHSLSFPSVNYAEGSAYHMMHQITAQMHEGVDPVWVALGG